MHIDDEHIVNDIIQFPTTTLPVNFHQTIKKLINCTNTTIIATKYSKISPSRLFSPPPNNNTLQPNLRNKILLTSADRGI